MFVVMCLTVHELCLFFLDLSYSLDYDNSVFVVTRVSQLWSLENTIVSRRTYSVDKYHSWRWIAVHIYKWQELCVKTLPQILRYPQALLRLQFSGYYLNKVKSVNSILRFINTDFHELQIFHNFNNFLFDLNVLLWYFPLDFNSNFVWNVHNISLARLCLNFTFMFEKECRKFSHAL